MRCRTSRLLLAVIVTVEPFPAPERLMSSFAAELALGTPLVVVVVVVVVPVVVVVAVATTTVLVVAGTVVVVGSFRARW
jgi:hypothetical protein